MTRSARPKVAIFGGADLRAAASVLGLEGADDGRPDLVLVDLRDASACAAAGALPCDIPRVVVADEPQRALAAAVGLSAASIARSTEPAAIGPLVVAALPRTSRPATRTVLVTSSRGGTGRTLLVANLARRLASRMTVTAIDATGSGALGWWLSCAPRSWSELEGLAEELTADHLAVVAAEGSDVTRVIGGAPTAPTVTLVASTMRAAVSLTDVVLVDAPVLADERSRALLPIVDRVLVLSYDDPLSIATLAAAETAEDFWLLASQSRATRLAERDVFRRLPRDEHAVASVFAERGLVRGALGRAYDELADLIALDAS